MLKYKIKALFKPECWSQLRIFNAQYDKWMNDALDDPKFQCPKLSDVIVTLNDVDVWIANPFYSGMPLYICGYDYKHITSEFGVSRATQIRFFELYDKWKNRNPKQDVFYEKLKTLRNGI